MLTQLLNEECRMKNEEWELLFLFVKREEGRVKNRADTIWTRWRRCFIHIIYMGAYIHYIYKER